MGRLTRRVEEDGIKAIYINEKSEENFECFLENEYGYKTADKLAAYEDIIDEPEKLLIVDKFLLEKCEEINKLTAELAEYKKLEEEGLILRLSAPLKDVESFSLDGTETWLKLPCPLGHTVYKIDGAVWKGDREWQYPSYENAYIRETVFNVGLEQVFLTKEDAEQALERMKEVQDGED